MQTKSRLGPTRRYCKKRHITGGMSLVHGTSFSPSTHSCSTSPSTRASRISLTELCNETLLQLKNRLPFDNWLQRHLVIGRVGQSAMRGRIRTTINSTAKRSERDIVRTTSHRKGWVGLSGFSWVRSHAPAYCGWG